MDRPEIVRAPKSGRVLFWQPVLVAVLSVACYIQTAGYDFVYDDDIQIVLNPRIRSFSHAGSAFTENFWAFSSVGFFSNYYRPLLTLTFMAGYALGDLRPQVFHSINVLMHALAALAMFWLGCELWRQPGPSLWAALLFAAHPIHTESVAWVAGLTDVGCGLFYLLSLASYLRARRGGQRWVIWQILSVFSFLLALLYKEMALTLPLVIVLLDIGLDDKRLLHAARTGVRRWLWFGAGLATYTILRVNALGEFARTGIKLQLGAADWLLTLLSFMGKYVLDLLAPVRQNAFHPFRPFSELSFAECVPPIAVLLLWAGLASVLLRKDRLLGILAAGVLVTLVPVLNLGGTGQNMYAERYLYIPSVMFSLLLSALAFKFRVGSTTRTLLHATVIVVLGLLTIQRNSVWKNNKTLYTATLAVSPDATPFRINLGRILFSERNYDAARREFQAALEADARSFVSLPQDRAGSLLGLSSVASAGGDLNRAWRYAEEAKNVMPGLSDVYQNLGMLSGKRGNYIEAENLLRRALELQPSNAAARLNLGNIYFLRNDLPSAESAFRAAAESNPRWAAPRVSLALLLARTNRSAEAYRLLREALDLDPGNTQARETMRQVFPGTADTR